MTPSERESKIKEELNFNMNNLFFNLLNIEKFLADDEHLQDVLAKKSKEEDRKEAEVFFLDRTIVVDFERKAAKKESIKVIDIVKQYSVWSTVVLKLCVDNIDNIWNVTVFNHLSELTSLIQQIRPVIVSTGLEYKYFEEKNQPLVYKTIDDLKNMFY